MLKQVKPGDLLYRILEFSAIAGVVFLGIWYLQSGSELKAPVPESPQQKKAEMALKKEKDLAFFMGMKLVQGARNPSSVRFRFAGAMADGSDCFDLFAQNGLGGQSELMLVETKDHGYVWQEPQAQTEAFRRNWNAHCANKKPLVTVTDLLNEYANEQR